MSSISKIDRNNSFTLLRYFLAVNVFIGHYNVISGDSIFRLTSGFVNIGAFFCFSGFFSLITYKEGTKFLPYLKKRAKRLIPPYATIVILSTFCLGFISSLDICEYFKSVDTYKYLICNLLYMNFLAPDLPGVFDGNLTNAVNGSLWYMKVEWLLTLSVPIVIWIKNKFNISLRKLILLIIMISVLWRLYFLIQINNNYITYENGNRILKQFPGELIYFYTGMLIYMHYKWLKQHPVLVIGACIILDIIAFYIPFSDAMIAPTATCLSMVSIAIFCKFGEKITRKINFSYGLYLIHYPIIQTTISLWNNGNFNYNNNLIPFFISISLTWILAYFMNMFFNKLNNRSNKTIPQLR